MNCEKSCMKCEKRFIERIHLLICEFVILGNRKNDSEILQKISIFEYSYILSTYIHYNQTGCFMKTIVQTGLPILFIFFLYSCTYMSEEELFNETTCDFK